MIFSPNSFTSKGMRNSTVRNESRKLIKQIQIHVHSRPLHIVKTFKAGRREKHVATILNVNNLFCLLIFFSLITLISLLKSSISVTCDPSVTNNSRNTFWSRSSRCPSSRLGVPSRTERAEVIRDKAYLRRFTLEKITSNV